MDEKPASQSSEAADHADPAGQGYSVGTATAGKPKNEWKDLGIFLVKLALIVFVVRSFIFSPFSIPSESMLPRLLIGDYLFITKWNYGYSKHSLPFSLPLIPGRIFPGTPERGDVVVFKAPGHNGQDWIKRVIGLPGDSVQVVNGQVILNGKPVPKQPVAHFNVPISPNYPVAGPENDYQGCKSQFVAAAADGQQTCRIPQFRETLPGGKSYNVLDTGAFDQDNTGVFTVPAGHVFLMGDNRDNSTDSRFPPPSAGQPRNPGIGYVPLENIQGKAVVTFWSTDGSANWFLPWTWFSAARWGRIGEGF